MQRVVDVISACQMLPDPVNGHGSGGCRCVPTCTAMADFTEKLGPLSHDPTKTVEDAVLQFAKLWGGTGTVVSGFEPNQNFTNWVNAHGGIARNSSFAFEDIVAMIDQGNYGMIALGDYNKTRQADGSSPYAWHDPDGDGHVLIVRGYDTSNRSVAVNDPLIGTRFQPGWYSYASLVNARLYLLVEVQHQRVSSPAPTPPPVVQPAPVFVTVAPWAPSPATPWNSTLYGIASHYHLSIAQLLAFPENAPYRANIGLIHAGNQIRVS